MSFASFWHMNREWLSMQQSLVEHWWLKPGAWLGYNCQLFYFSLLCLRCDFSYSWAFNL